MRFWVAVVIGLFVLFLGVFFAVVVFCRFMSVASKSEVSFIVLFLFGDFMGCI